MLIALNFVCHCHAINGTQKYDHSWLSFVQMFDNTANEYSKRALQHFSSFKSRLNVKSICLQSVQQMISGFTTEEWVAMSKL